MPQVSLETLIVGVRSGENLASFPTDTVPALAARPDCAGAIFAAKQRPANKSLILMAATATDLWPFVVGSEAERNHWSEMATRYWPGALTLVLPASDRVPAAMNPADPSTIGIRVPNSAIAQQVLAQTGPLATTSVNRSGQPPLTTASDIEASFPDVLILAEASVNLMKASTKPSLEVQAPSERPSTVIKWTGNRWEILRQGTVEIGQPSKSG